MNLTSFIDHTVLKPGTTAQEVDRLCAEAQKFGFAAVCIPPFYVPQARQQLNGTPVKTATVVGFPLGYNRISIKAEETADAITAGAQEIDVVHCIAAVKGKNWKYLEAEVAAVSRETADAGAALKIILETSLLTDEEIIRCCEMYRDHPVQFLKTSTGFADGGGATVHAVELMRKHLPANIQIKASGGIRTYAFAKELIDAGATRLGCSASVAIVGEAATTTD